MRHVYHKLKQRQYSNIFRRIYTESKNRIKNLLNLHEYTNPFARQEFEILNSRSTQSFLVRAAEYVFVCLLKKQYQDELVPIYVSKEYNVSGSESYMAGRFVFRNREYPRHPEYHYMLLAEKPATVYTRSDYNVELHYLEIRKRRQPGKIALEV